MEELKRYDQVSILGLPSAFHGSSVVYADTTILDKKNFDLHIVDTSFFNPFVQQLERKRETTGYEFSKRDDVRIIPEVDYELKRWAKVLKRQKKSLIRKRERLYHRIKDEILEKIFIVEYFRKINVLRFPASAEAASVQDFVKKVDYSIRKNAAHKFNNSESFVNEEAPTDYMLIAMAVYQSLFEGRRSSILTKDMDLIRIGRIVVASISQDKRIQEHVKNFPIGIYFFRDVERFSSVCVETFPDGVAGLKVSAKNRLVKEVEECFNDLSGAFRSKANFQR